MEQTVENYLLLSQNQIYITFLFSILQVDLVLYLRIDHSEHFFRLLKV